jgi:hypothetical protein
LRHAVVDTIALRGGFCWQWIRERSFYSTAAEQLYKAKGTTFLIVVEEQEDVEE